jgi:hypothetical protein
MGTSTVIIETSDNRFYRVWETEQDGLEHVWFGYPAKHTKHGWTHKANARKELVRKAATRLVEA